MTNKALHFLKNICHSSFNLTIIDISCCKSVRYNACVFVDDTRKLEKQQSFFWAFRQRRHDIILCILYYAIKQNNQ